MIAIDTNILVYVHRRESPFHQAASPLLKLLCESGKAWAVPWPCVHEFIGVVTNNKIYAPASTLAEAFKQLANWRASGTMRLIGEGPQHVSTLEEVAVAAKVTGPKIHDARIAAICLQHGVRELWTADRDFSRYPKLKTRNPLIK